MGVAHTRNGVSSVGGTTPQACRRSLLVQAHEEGKSKGLAATDDAMLVEALGMPRSGW